MQVRDLGFRVIFDKFEEQQIEKLVAFHRENGGLSRYVKIRYFYEKILNKNITEAEISQYAMKFSRVMKEELINPKYLIQETIEYIKNNYKKYPMHIVSGSDGKELRFLCEKLGISNYFMSIDGSPTPKNELIREVFKKYNYNKSETIIIGDSKNDYEAAIENQIEFYGYNNEQVRNLSGNYIENFRDFV